MEREDRENAYRINNSVSFVPETTDSLDAVIDIIDDDIKNKNLPTLMCLLKLKQQLLLSSKPKQLTMNLLH